MAGVAPHYALYGGRVSPPDPPPNPLGISPEQGPAGTFVGVYGNAMNTVTSVTFFGTPMANMSIVGTTMVQGNVPPGPLGAVPVVVHYRGGSTRCPQDFTYLEAEEPPEPDPEGEGGATRTDPPHT